MDHAAVKTDGAGAYAGVVFTVGRGGWRRRFVSSSDGDGAHPERHGAPTRLGSTRLYQPGRGAPHVLCGRGGRVPGRVRPERRADRADLPPLFAPFCNVQSAHTIL